MPRSKAIREIPRDDLFWILSREHFTVAESRELSKVGRLSLALGLIIEERREMRARFEKRADRKIASGAWSRRQVPRKWIDSVKRMYRRRHWIVKHKRTDPNTKLKRGDINPWAMYRFYEQEAPPEEGYRPAKKKKYRGKAHLERGLLTIRKIEKGTLKASSTQIRQWIGQKREAVRNTRDSRRKVQLRIEIRRLEALV